MSHLRAAAPVTVTAEKLVCRSLGIVQDGKDITKEALNELGRRFQYELSPSVLTALCVPCSSWMMWKLLQLKPP
ncbi:hypothetical protein D1007_56044 [Hordeum vulgare]|nr:hypothetical protein D1007_56044 [Hordeum vulgare]